VRFRAASPEMLVIYPAQRRERSKVGIPTDAKTPTTNVITGFEDVNQWFCWNLPLHTEYEAELRNPAKKPKAGCVTCIFTQKVRLF
jgi:hypothetical protein